MIRDVEKRILVIQRANPPDKVVLDVTGRSCRSRRNIGAGCYAGVYEETGLVIRIVRELGQLGVPDGKGGIYEIHDFLAESLSGEVVAGVDAAAIGWFRSNELSKLPLTPDLLQYLGQYGVYP